MTTRPDPSGAVLSRVRQVCFDFPGTEEKLSHGAPFFHVRGKGFASFASGHHNDGRVAVWCKSTLDEQKRLVRTNPAVYFVPPYVGVKGWVGVRLDGDDPDYEALAIVVEEAWRSVVPKKLESAAAKPPPDESPLPTTDPDVSREALEKITAICEALPGTVTERAPGDVTFRVKKRPYVYFLDNHHRDGKIAVCVRLPRDECDELIAKHPSRYYLPAYIGARGWLAVRVDTAKVPWNTISRRITASYESVAG